MRPEMKIQEKKIFLIGRYKSRVVLNSQIKNIFNEKLKFQVNAGISS